MSFRRTTKRTTAVGYCCRFVAAGLSLVVSSITETGVAQAGNHGTITVADASLSAAFYSDSSCLLTVDSLAQSGQTVIDADVDDVGSRMLIHCDTESGRRLTLLARGDSLNVSQRVPLLTREQIQEGEFGMIVWLTRSGVHYTDDSAPRRYVIGGSVMLRKSPPVDVAGSALHNQRQSFASVTGVLEPILKTDDRPIVDVVNDSKASSESDDNSDNTDENDSDTETPADRQDGDTDAQGQSQTQNTTHSE